MNHITRAITTLAEAFDRVGAVFIPDDELRGRFGVAVIDLAAKFAVLLAVVFLMVAFIR